MTNQHSKNRKWTPDNIKLLRVLWVQNRTISHIAGQMFPGCTEASVRLKAYYLGLPHRKLDTGPWTEAAEAYLRARWAEGWSAGKIQIGLETTHGAKVTRSAVIGKAHRLGCGRHPNSRPDAMSAVRKMTRKSQRNVSTSWKPVGRPPVAFKVEPLPTPPPPSNFASAVKFGAREAHQCAYITHQVGSDVYCCGNEVIPGQSWCPSCKSRVYLPVATLRRRKEWTDETTLKIRELQKLIAE
jgi:hypothetical protein